MPFRKRCLDRRRLPRLQRDMPERHAVRVLAMHVDDRPRLHRVPDERAMQRDGRGVVSFRRRDVDCVDLVSELHKQLPQRTASGDRMRDDSGPHVRDVRGEHDLQWECDRAVPPEYRPLGSDFRDLHGYESPLFPFHDINHHERHSDQHFHPCTDNNIDRSGHEQYSIFHHILHGANDSVHSCRQHRCTDYGVVGAPKYCASFRHIEHTGSAINCNHTHSVFLSAAPCGATNALCRGDVHRSANDEFCRCDIRHRTDNASTAHEHCARCKHATSNHIHCARCRHATSDHIYCAGIKPPALD